MLFCSGLGIDNLYIDVTAEEIPIMDGSEFDLLCRATHGLDDRFLMFGDAQPADNIFPGKLVFLDHLVDKFSGFWMG